MTDSVARSMRDDPLAVTVLEDPFEATLDYPPYPGLRPFVSAEWPIFFGRETMTDEIIDLVTKKRLVVVHGDSGSGKSSIVRAGVLVQLQQGHAATDASWRTCAMLPREDPLGNLARALAGLLAAEPTPDQILDVRHILNRGRRAPETLSQILRQSESDHICILVDQFEELFTFAKRHGPDDARLFVDILVGLQENPPPGLYAIITMRSEFLGHCARYEGLAEAVNKTQYLLPRMERPALLRAIREPAPLYGGEVSQELAERLIADAGGGQDQLPLIQHGLMRLWRRKTGSSTKPADDSGMVWRLGLEDYLDVGGLATLLSVHADEVMAKAAPDARREKIVEHLFRALTEINADSNAARRPRTLAELQAVTGSDEQTLRDIIDHFRAEGISFLTPYSDAPIKPGTLIDISHEALIRCWRKIADDRDGWLQREFDDGLTWQSLRVQAQRFLYDPEQTLSPAATSDRETWIQHLPSLAWCERYGGGWGNVRAFLEASRRQRDKQIAEEQRERRRKYLSRAIAAMLIFLTIPSVFSFEQWRIADQARLVAEEQRVKAEYAASLLRSQQAQQALQAGQPVTAIQLALAGLPELPDSESARPWVATTAGALVEALAAQREFLVLSGHEGPLYAAEFSPDGTRILSGAEDGTVRVWDAASGAALLVLRGHEGRVLAAEFSPDGARIVSGAEDGTVRVWDAASGADLRVLRSREGWVYAAAFSPDGARIVSGADDGTVRVWDAASGKQLLVLNGHQGQVFAAEFSPDGVRIVSGAGDGTVRVWDAASGKQLLVLNGHQGEVNAAAFSPDGARIVSGADDGTVRVWDAVSGAELSVLGGHQGRVYAAEFSPDGVRIVDGAFDGTVRVWDAASGAELLVLRGQEGPVHAAEFSPDGGRIVSGAGDGTVRVWDMAGGAGLLVLRGYEGGQIFAAGFSPDGERIVDGASYGTARVWNAASGAELLALKGHEGPVLAAEFSPDGERIVSGAGDGTVRVWDAASGVVLLGMGDHQGPVYAAKFSPDSARIVSGAEGGMVQVWDARSGAPLLRLRGHQGRVFAAAFSPDGARIVSGAEDRTVRVWDAASGAELRVLPGHDGWVFAAAFSPDGTRILSGAEDGTVRVWDAASGAELLVLRGYEGPVYAAEFSPDGARIVSGANDGTVRVWDAASGAELLVLHNPRERVFAVAFSPDGSRILSGASDSTIQVIRVLRTKQELIETARRRLPRELTTEERRRFHLDLN